MRLHSDENTRCASQWSSLVSSLMLLSWFLPSSVVKKNPTSTCLFGQFRKMNSLAFLSIASSRPQADLHLYCSCWVQCIDKYETFLPPEFQHVELQTQEHPAHLGFSKVSQTTTPNHSGSPPAISEPAPMLFSCLSSGSAASTPHWAGQGEISGHRQWVGLLLVLSLQQAKEKQDKQSVYLR